jgi:hypothetical protein
MEMDEAVNKAVMSMRLFQLVDEWDLNLVKMNCGLPDMITEAESYQRIILKRLNNLI